MLRLLLLLLLLLLLRLLLRRRMLARLRARLSLLALSLLPFLRAALLYVEGGDGDGVRRWPQYGLYVGESRRGERPSQAREGRWGEGPGDRGLPLSLSLDLDLDLDLRCCLAFVQQIGRAHV